MLLHEKKGLNPRVVVCERCGGDYGVMMLCAEEYIWECCAEEYIGRPKRCHNCGTSTGFRRVRKIEDNEKIVKGMCVGCEAEEMEFAKVVAAGGVHWRCVVCGKLGVIKGDAPLAQEVRKRLGIEVPGACGIEFGRDDCPVCGGGAVELNLERSKRNE